MKKTWILLLITLFALGNASFLWAQEDEPLRLDLIVTKDPSGQGVPRYQSGDALRIGVRVNQDAYVYLFEVDEGKVIAIHPNQYDDEQHKFFRANELYTIPPAGADYEFILGEMEAQRRLVGLATPLPLAPAILQGFKEINDLEGGIWALDEVRFVVGDAQVRESLADLPARVTVSTRDTTSAQETVSSPETQPSQADEVVALDEAPQLITPILPEEPAPPAEVVEVTGNFSISSIPEGAEVFVDDKRMGITPLVTNVDTGVRNIVLRLVGYKEVRFGLEVRKDQDSVVETYLVAEEANNTITAPSDADLQPGTPPTSLPSAPTQITTPPSQPSQGSSSSSANEDRANVTIRTNISGAEIFLDGNSVGKANGIGELQLNNLFAGERQISITADGFHTLDTRRYLAAGTQVLNLPLTPIRASGAANPAPSAPTQVPSQPTTVSNTTASSNNGANFTTTPVGTTPTNTTAASDNAGTGLEQFASPSFGLRNYPNARLLNLVESTNRADSFIEVNVPAANLYAFFEQQLVNYGWQTNGLNESTSTILGDFVAEGGYKLRLEVAYIGGNLYRLSVYNY